MQQVQNNNNNTAIENFSHKILYTPFLTKDNNISEQLSVNSNTNIVSPETSKIQQPNTVPITNMNIIDNINTQKRHTPSTTTSSNSSFPIVIKKNNQITQENIIITTHNQKKKKSKINIYGQLHNKHRNYFGTCLKNVFTEFRSPHRF